MTGSPQPGVYTVEGMKFHMRGRWEIVLTIAADGREDTALIQFDL